MSVFPSSCSKVEEGAPELPVVKNERAESCFAELLDFGSIRCALSVAADLRGGGECRGR